jgi:predicted aconitase with swiveling domain
MQLYQENGTACNSNMWIKKGMEVKKVYKVRVIKAGYVQGPALVSPEPVGFLGGVDGMTGIVTEKGHPLEGQCIAGKVLVFPTGKGSTVGSYVLYQLSVNELAPVAIINEESEPIVAVGAIISDIPMVDCMPVSEVNTGDRVCVNNDEVTVVKSV